MSTSDSVFPSGQTELNGDNPPRDKLTVYRIITRINFSHQISENLENDPYDPQKMEFWLKPKDSNL